MKSYRAAIDNHAPQQIEASSRLATLLRAPGKQQDLGAAKEVIDKMVSADPKNYQVYLERGRYLRQAARRQKIGKPPRPTSRRHLNLSLAIPRSTGNWPPWSWTRSRRISRRPVVF